MQMASSKLQGRELGVRNWERGEYERLVGDEKWRVENDPQYYRISNLYNEY